MTYLVKRLKDVDDSVLNVLPVQAAGMGGVHLDEVGHGWSGDQEWSLGSPAGKIGSQSNSANLSPHGVG